MFDGYDREAFEHPSLEGIDNLTPESKEQMLQREELANIARTFGLAEVVRWKPRYVRNPLGFSILSPRLIQFLAGSESGEIRGIKSPGGNPVRYYRSTESGTR